jgi:hypothetical protein
MRPRWPRTSVGLHGKVLVDLLGLGRVAQAARQTDEALGYYERARAVAARAAGDDAGAAAVEP